MDLHLLCGHGDEVVEASGPGDLTDGEREAVRCSHEARDDDHLVRLESSTHTPLVNVEGATSISNILLVDVDVESFSPYKYVPTPWVKHTKTTVRGAPNLENLSCSKLDFSPPLAIVAAVVTALLETVDPPSTARWPKVSSPSSALVLCALGSSNRGL